jgi:hypothetical protein
MNKLVILNYFIIISMLFLLFSVPQTVETELTDVYLKDLLRDRDHIDVHVSSMTSNMLMRVRMKMVP